MRHIWPLPGWLLFTACCLIHACSDQPKETVPADSVIARVDGESITLREFRTFYESDIDFGIDSTGYRALINELNRYIDQILAYRKARKTGFTQDSIFIRARNWEKERAILRQLYREQIEEAIQIQESDLKRMYKWYHTEVKVRHLFHENPKKITQWYKQLRQGLSFEKLAMQAFRDSVLRHNGGELGWQKLGELEMHFAKAVDGLNKNEISKPVRTRWGYHIIQLLDRKEQVILREDAYQKEKPSLRKKLMRKRGRALSHKFISRFMKQYDPQPDPQTLRILWQTVAGSEAEKHRLQSPVTLTNQKLHNLRAKLKKHLNQPLVRFKDGSISLGRYLAAVSNIPVSNRPRFETPRELSNKLGKWVRDRFLLQKARSMNLDNHPRVQNEVQRFVRQQSYLRLVHGEMEAIRVPVEIQRYFEKRDESNYSKADAHLRRFHNLQEWLWWKARRNVHQQLKEMNIPVEIEFAELKEEARRIDWKNRIPMVMIRRPQ